MGAGETAARKDKSLGDRPTMALLLSMALAFSLLHVVLEFPLNALAARQLGAALWRTAQPKRPVRAGPARRP